LTDEQYVIGVHSSGGVDRSSYGDLGNVWDEFLTAQIENDYLLDDVNTPADWHSDALTPGPHYVGDILTATLEVTDLDGASNPIIINWHRWDGNQWNEIGHTGNSYTVTINDIGSYLGFSGSFVDDKGFSEISGNPYWVDSVVALGPLGGDYYQINGVSERVNGSSDSLDIYYALNVERDAATITVDNGNILVTSGSETDTLLSIERLQFSDGLVAFDTEGESSAGAGYRLYKAAFDRTPDEEGLGYWINELDQGFALHEVANSFVISQEFKNLYGADLNNEGFVTALYNNVLDRDPDQGGLDYWVNDMENNGMSRADVLASFSESAENIANTDPLIELGVVYQPYGDVLLG